MGFIPWQWIHFLRSSHPTDFSTRTLSQSLTACRVRHFTLTHMCQTDDECLAVELKDVDRILVCHEHSVSVRRVNGRYILKSGTDFRTLELRTLEM